MGFGDVQHVIEFVEFFDNDDYTFAATRACERQLNEFLILESVQHQQAVEFAPAPAQHRVQLSNQPRVQSRNVNLRADTLQPLLVADSLSSDRRTDAIPDIQTP